MTWSFDSDSCANIRIKMKNGKNSSLKQINFYSLYFSEYGVKFKILKMYLKLKWYTLEST